MRDGRHLIVCMDDSLMVHEMLRDGFEGTGYMLELIRDIPELEQKVLSQPETIGQVDLFVLDFDMPEMTGTQIASVLDQMDERLKSVPFLIFSGRPREEVTKAIEDANAYSYSFASNFRGYIEKHEGAIAALMARIEELFGPKRQERLKK
jgi:CheY-like chemotaxis protein